MSYQKADIEYIAFPHIILRRQFHTDVRAGTVETVIRNHSLTEPHKRIFITAEFGAFRLIFQNMEEVCTCLFMSTSDIVSPQKYKIMQYQRIYTVSKRVKPLQ